MTTPIREEKPTVVITGISRGLGHALAEDFAKRGYLVFGCARSDCNPTFCHDNIFFTPRVDVSCDSQVQSWAKQVLAKAGAPHILINNAATANKNASSPIWEITEKQFSQVIDVNLKGPANVIRHFAKAMCEAQRGIIVNINSRWGEDKFLLGKAKTVKPPTSLLPYSASKSGLHGMTLFISNFLNQYNVRAHSLFSDLVQTDLLNEQFHNDWDEAATPEEAAENVIKEIYEAMTKEIKKEESPDFIGASQDQT